MLPYLSEGSELRYYPTLYHTATGGSRVNSSIPYTTIFNGYNIKIAKGFAVSIDRKKKVITTKDNKNYSYDILVLGLGVVTNYFGIDGMEKYSYSIKSQSEAARFKTYS
jgi:NADH dehydrogenase